jgi:hypothetical protein
MKPGTLVITNEACLGFVDSVPKEKQLTIFDIKTKRIQKGKIGFIVEDSFENQTGEEAVLISISGIPVVEILKKSVITLDEFLLKNTLSEES